MTQQIRGMAFSAMLVGGTLLGTVAGAVPRMAMAQTVAAAKPIPQPDADMQAVLDAYAGFRNAPLEILTPDSARRQKTAADAVKQVLLTQGRDTTPTALVPGVTSADRTVPGAAGPLGVTVYTPAGAGPFPVIVYYHGGGWVIADRKVYDGGARGLSKQANAVVVSVDYRRAPEARFPAQHDDALAAYRYVTGHAREFGGDGRRFALAGESAGGNLAVATAVAARDAGLAKPAAVVSVYPIGQGDTTTASYLQNANATFLSRGGMTWFFQHTLRTQADRRDPRITLPSANLRGLAPVTLINADIDVLRDDGAQLERALRAAGVPVERRVYPGVTHEFFGMAAVVRKAADAQQYAGERLRAAFAR